MSAWTRAEVLAFMARWSLLFPAKRPKRVQPPQIYSGPVLIYFHGKPVAELKSVSYSGVRKSDNTIDPRLWLGRGRRVYRAKLTMYLK